MKLEVEDIFRKREKKIRERFRTKQDSSKNENTQVKLTEISTLQHATSEDMSWQ